MTTPNGTTGPAPAEAVIDEWFTGRVAEARAAMEAAQAALDTVESEAAQFRNHGELPPAVGGMQSGWQMASWVVGRTSRAGTAAMRNRSRVDYDRATAEQVAVFAWMVDHGYEVPDAFQEKR